METLYKEIDLIQEVIKRMSNNSFLLKGWHITILSAILVINKEQLSNTYNVPYIIMVIPVLLFWYLDAYYLRQETLFRKLYEWVIRERIRNNNDFLFDLNASQRFGKQTRPLTKVLFSTTLIVFYFIPVCILLFMILRAK